jgi:hypothetical protein
MTKTFRQRFTNIILCDDVRAEINNKFMLIGVYTADILVAAFPQRLRFSMYFEYIPEESGEKEMFFKLAIGDEKPAQFQLKLSVSKPNINTPIIIPPVEMTINKESEFRVECSEDNKKWIRLITKHILIGDIPTIWSPSVSPPPS